MTEQGSEYCLWKQRTTFSLKRNKLVGKKLVEGEARSRNCDNEASEPVVFMTGHGGGISG